MSNSPPIRLAFGATLWRLFLILAVCMEVTRWRRIRLRPWGQRHGLGLSVAYLLLLTPKILFTAFLIAAAATVILDLIVRLVARPLVGHWYAPPLGDDPMGSALAFQLRASEAVLGRLPARMVTGRRLVRGSLVRTDRRIAFVPDSWDREPWSLPEADLTEIRTRPTSSPWRSVVHGLPDRLVIGSKGGAEAEFVLADPREVLAWYSEEVARGLATYDPSPMELL